MLLHETVELLFSAIAAPFNPAFKRDATKARRPLALRWASLLESLL